MDAVVDEVVSLPSYLFLVEGQDITRFDNVRKIINYMFLKGIAHLA